MKIISALITLLLSIAVTMVTTYFVLNRNLYANFYPLDADSIAIPIFENGIFCALIFILFTIGILLPKKHIALKTLSVLMLFLASLVSLVNVLMWLMPNHYLVSAAFYWLFLVCGFYIYMVIKYGDVTSVAKVFAGFSQ
jgi:hypothetical protein